MIQAKQGAQAQHVTGGPAEWLYARKGAAGSHLYSSEMLDGVKANPLVFSALCWDSSIAPTDTNPLEKGRLCHRPETGDNGGGNGGGGAGH